MKPSGLSLVSLTPDDYADQPWKNGKGTTREIAKDGADPFLWRLSWAVVPESGPFSSFPGYDRSLTLLSGGPMTLSHDGKPARTIAPLHPHLFRGESLTTAQVDTPTEDFNLFTLRDKAKGAVYPARFADGEELQFSLQRTEHFLFCLEGTVEVLDPNTDGHHTLESGHTLRASRETDKEFLNLRAMPKDGSAIALWIVVSLL
jgi:uncharacterized protein